LPKVWCQNEEKAQTKTLPTMRPDMNFRPTIIRNPAHLRLVAQLPCCCTGNPFNVVAHHLVRDPNGEHCLSRKSGDNWAIPLRNDLHVGGNKSLHNGPLDEPEFLAQYGVDGIALAKQLWALTEQGLRGAKWIEAGERVVRG